MKPVGSPTAGARGLAGHAAHVNVTPLIDIVMVLIVFYLLVGQLAMDRKGEVELPPSVAGERAEAEETPISIAIDAGGGLTVEGAEAAPGRLRAMLDVLTRQRPADAVQIRADRAVAYAEVRAVLEACREAGIDRVELAASAEAEGAEAAERGRP